MAPTLVWVEGAQTPESLPRGREGLPLLPHVPGLIPPSPADIAQHICFGRQEDAHEFLRYTIDAMQKACLSRCAKYVGPLPARRWCPAPAGGDSGVDVSPRSDSGREVLGWVAQLCPSATQLWAVVCLLPAPPRRRSCGPVPGSRGCSGFGSCPSCRGIQACPPAQPQLCGWRGAALPGAPHPGQLPCLCRAQL